MTNNDCFLVASCKSFSVFPLFPLPLTNLSKSRVLGKPILSKSIGKSLNFLKKRQACYCYKSFGYQKVMSGCWQNLDPKGLILRKKELFLSKQTFPNVHRGFVNKGAGARISFNLFLHFSRKRYIVETLAQSFTGFSRSIEEVNKNHLGDGRIKEKQYWNQCFDKGRLKNFVLWFFLNNGQHKSTELVEKFKSIGFEYATKAGISLGIEDLKIPPKKSFLIFEAEKTTAEAVKQYQRGDITGVERFQRLIDTWHRTSEQLKQEVIDHFEATDILNPVYMMAFSGARGNISQVRQLVGMRGLMANPQGQIIDFPIRSNFREGLTLTEYIISSYGARKGIVDTALRTANAGYLTRRLVDVAQHVIISNFDCGTRRGIFLSDMKEGNKTILSLQSRLVGRVCARDIFINGEKIAKRNNEISIDLAYKISKEAKKVFVRSALTCETKKLVCQLCYGWSLAQGNLVAIGEAIGVIAAQSIGEPGTQLTMRTFHTGGVFSGDISDQIRMPFNGIITYNAPIPGTLIRTSEGKIAFLTKSSGSFTVSNFNENDLKPKALVKKKFKIPEYTLLFAKHGEFVLFKEVVAQISSISKQKNATDDAELTIKSDIEGQFFLQRLQVKETKVGPKLKPNQSVETNSINRLKNKTSLEDFNNQITNLSINSTPMDSIFSAWNWGNAWILSGKLYNSAQPSVFFPKIGDFINQRSSILISKLISPKNFSGFIKLDMPSHLSKAKDLTSPVSKEYFKAQKQKSSFYKGSRTENGLPSYSFEFLSFPLSSVIYKKIGYFVKLNSSSSQILKHYRKPLAFYKRHPLGALEPMSFSGNLPSSRFRNNKLVKASPLLGILTNKDMLFVIPPNVPPFTPPKGVRTTGQTPNPLKSSQREGLRESGYGVKNSVHFYPSNWKSNSLFVFQWFPSLFQTKTAGTLAIEEIREIVNSSNHFKPLGDTKPSMFRVQIKSPYSREEPNMEEQSSALTEKQYIKEKLMCLTKSTVFTFTELKKLPFIDQISYTVASTKITKAKKRNQIHFSRLLWIPNRKQFNNSLNCLTNSKESFNMVNSLFISLQNQNLNKKFNVLHTKLNNKTFFAMNELSLFNLSKRKAFKREHPQYNLLSYRPPMTIQEKLFINYCNKSVSSSKMLQSLRDLLSPNRVEGTGRLRKNPPFLSKLNHLSYKPLDVTSIHLSKAFGFKAPLLEKNESLAPFQKSLPLDQKVALNKKSSLNWVYYLPEKIIKKEFLNKEKKGFFFYPGKSINSEITFDQHIVYVEPIIISLHHQDTFQLKTKTFTVENCVINNNRPFCTLSKTRQFSFLRSTISFTEGKARDNCFNKNRRRSQSTVIALNIQKVEEYFYNSLNNTEFLNIKNDLYQLTQFHLNPKNNLFAISNGNSLSKSLRHPRGALNLKPLALDRSPEDNNVTQSTPLLSFRSLGFNLKKIFFNKSFLSSLEVKKLQSPFFNKQNLSPQILTKYPSIDADLFLHFSLDKRKKKSTFSLSIVKEAKKANFLVSFFVMLPNKEKYSKQSSLYGYPEKYRFNFISPRTSYYSTPLKSSNTVQLVKKACTHNKMSLLNSISFFNLPYLSSSLTQTLEPMFVQEQKQSMFSKVSRNLVQKPSSSFFRSQVKFYGKKLAEGQFISSLVPFSKTYSYSPFEGEVLQITSPFNSILKPANTEKKRKWKKSIYKFSQLIEKESTFLQIKQHTSMILTKKDFISFYLPIKNKPFNSLVKTNQKENLLFSQPYLVQAGFVSLRTDVLLSITDQKEENRNKESQKIYKLPSISCGFPEKRRNNQKTVKKKIQLLTPFKSNSKTGQKQNKKDSYNPKTLDWVGAKVNLGEKKLRDRLSSSKTLDLRSDFAHKNQFGLAFLLGDFILSGDSLLLNSNLLSSLNKERLKTAVTNSGQIIHLNKEKVTLRKGQPLFISPKSILHKYDGDFIDPKSPVITLSYQRLKTGDIVQGIPKIEQFFEARTTKRGRLFRDSLPNLLKALFKRYLQKLPLDKAARQSFYKIQQIIVDGVLRVYRSQGVTIADKHLEIIVKQMTSKVRILEGGQTGFFPGEIVDFFFVEQVNQLLITGVKYEPLVLGITKSSLEVDSFLSAASFQQTTRVLSGAAISRKKDFLKGLKENVILGNLIPAGTGYLVYLNDSSLR